MEEAREVIIYTDGACEPNPGPGGYGVVLLYDSMRKELSGGFKLTTNNRMELVAAIKGLEALKEPCKVTLYSDSEYLVKAMQLGWVQRWKRKGWRRSSKDKRANKDLWVKLLELCSVHQVEFVWVRGHSGQVYNERCDQLSTQAMVSKHLDPDPGYEEDPPPSPQMELPFNL